jgi:hypothetical protein
MRGRILCKVLPVHPGRVRRVALDPPTEYSSKFWRGEPRYLYPGRGVPLQTCPREGVPGTQVGSLSVCVLAAVLVPRGEVVQTLQISGVKSGVIWTTS